MERVALLGSRRDGRRHDFLCARGAPSADILPHEAVREAAARALAERLGKGALLRHRDRPSRPLRVDRRAPRRARRLAGDGRQRLARGGRDAVRAPARARRPGRRRAADLRPHAAAPAAARGRAGAGAAGGRRARPRAPSRRRSPRGRSSSPTSSPTPTTRPAARSRREKRARLVELAAEHGFWIFEDDPYRELPFEGEPLETMLSLDRADRVVHASSFSKTVSPGVRVGYLAGPGGGDREAGQARQRDLHLAEHAGRVDRARALPLRRARPQHRLRQGRAEAPAATRSSRPCASRSPRPSSSSPRAATSSGSTSPRAPTRSRCWPRRKPTASPSSPAPTS